MVRTRYRRDGGSLNQAAMPNSSPMKLACANGIVLRYPPHSSFANHLHCFDSLQRSPRRRKRTVALSQPGPLLHRAMILLHYIMPRPVLCRVAARRAGFRWGRSCFCVRGDRHNQRLSRKARRASFGWKRAGFRPLGVAWAKARSLSCMSACRYI